MLGKNPFQREFPFSNRTAERVANGAAGANASCAYVENHLRAQLLQQEAWVVDTETGEHRRTLVRFSLVGTEKQFTEAAKRIISGRAYGTDRTHDDEVKVIFAHEAGKVATVTVNIPSTMFKQLVSKHAFVTTSTAGHGSP